MVDSLSILYRNATLLTEQKDKLGSLAAPIYGSTVCAFTSSILVLPVNCKDLSIVLNFL